MNYISTFIISITNHHLSSITDHHETLINRASFSILTRQTTSNIKSIIIIHQQASYWIWSIIIKHRSRIHHQTWLTHHQQIKSIQPFIIINPWHQHIASPETVNRYQQISSALITNRYQPITITHRYIISKSTADHPQIINILSRHHPLGGTLFAASRQISSYQRLAEGGLWDGFSVASRDRVPWWFVGGDGFAFDSCGVCDVWGDGGLPVWWSVFNMATQTTLFIQTKISSIHFLIGLLLGERILPSVKLA